MAAPQAAFQPPASTWQQAETSPPAAPSIAWNGEAQALAVPTAGQRAGMITASYVAILQNYQEAVVMLTASLSRDGEAAAAPPELASVCLEWLGKQVLKTFVKGLDELSKTRIGLPVGTVLSEALSLAAKLQEGAKKASSAQEKDAAYSHLNRLQQVISRAASDMRTSGEAWAIATQSFCDRADPAVQQQALAYLILLYEETIVTEKSHASLEGALAGLVGHWTARHGGRVHVIARGPDLEVDEIDLDAPYDEQFVATLQDTCAYLGYTGLDLFVTWFPEPGMPLLALKGVVPAQGTPSITYSSNGIPRGHHARFLAFLRNPASFLLLCGGE